MVQRISGQLWRSLCKKLPDTRGRLVKIAKEKAPSRREIRLSDAGGTAGLGSSRNSPDRAGIQLLPLQNTRKGIEYISVYARVRRSLPAPRSCRVREWQGRARAFDGLRIWAIPRNGKDDECRLGARGHLPTFVRMPRSGMVARSQVFRVLLRHSGGNFRRGSHSAIDSLKRSAARERRARL